MKTSDFDYHLPPELIAQSPLEPRDSSRLMVLHRKDCSIRHEQFVDITKHVVAGDVLVFNDSRVIPARLHGTRVGTSGKVEILLLRRRAPCAWEALVKPGKRLDVGARVQITDGTGHGAGTVAEVTGLGSDGVRVISFSDEKLLPVLGKIPLPPYIHLPLANPERYQTVYAREPGSAAAPTAGLHFTPELIAYLERKEVRCLFVTLHVGLDTFRPVTEDSPQEHAIHGEYGMVSDAVAAQLSQARAEGHRIICVGTTSVRLVEAVAQAGNPLELKSFAGWVDLFILPGHRFRMVDGLITNFHLPRSTLLMLVSAFAGKDLIRRAYDEAIAQKYHFYSFGDAMLVL